MIRIKFFDVSSMHKTTQNSALNDIIFCLDGFGRDDSKRVRAMNVNIPNVDDAVVQKLKQLAWQEGVGFDDSLRRLLTEAAFMRGTNSRNREAAARRFKQPA